MNEFDSYRVPHISDFVLNRDKLCKLLKVGALCAVIVNEPG